MADLFQENLYSDYSQCFKKDEVLFQSETEHQELIIFRNDSFGRVMALDGVIQTTERDEFIYHEMMVHVPLFAHPAPKKVLIIGGGDGGILREVLKHQNVESVTQVEIDQAVIDLCTRFLPRHSDGAYQNPRARIVIDDGANFVRTCQENFDVIISDSTDPYGPGEVLFTKDFYTAEKKCLNEGGIMVAQNGVAFMQLSEVVTSKKRLKPLYRDVHFYSASVPTYIGGIMCFAWATDDESLRQTDLSTLHQRYEASGVKTRYYNPEIHVASFALPQYVMEALATV
jgi:spermidine synthase